MPKLLSVEPKENFTLLLKYDDGLEGEYPCSDILKQEEFSKLNDITLFTKVSLDPQSNNVCWDGNTTLCKNALYKHLELQRLMKIFQIDLNKII